MEHIQANDSIGSPNSPDQNYRRLLGLRAPTSGLREDSTIDWSTHDNRQIWRSEYTFTSGQGSENPGITGVCNKIIIKPSNTAFGVQGGVSSSSRTNRLKYDTVMSNVHLKNYATARATIDTGYVNIKGQSMPKAECVTVRQDRAHVTGCNYSH